MSQTKPDTPI